MWKRYLPFVLTVAVSLCLVLAYAGHSLAQNHKVLGPWYKLAQIGEPASVLHARLGKPFMVLRKAGGLYEAFSIDRDLAWFVAYIADGKVTAYQVISKNHQHSHLDDGSGIRLGATQSKLVSTRGWGNGKDAAAPHVLAYTASGGAFRFYGIDVNKRVERMGVSLSDTDMPPAIKWFQMSGWELSRAYPVDTARGPAERQEDRYIATQRCEAGNHFQTLDRMPLIHDGHPYHQVLVRCGLTAYTETMYFSLHGPGAGFSPAQMVAMLPGVKQIAQVLGGASTHTLSLPQSVQIHPMSGQGSTNTNVWIIDMGYKGAKIPPNGARVTGPSYPTVEYQINFNPNNPVTSVDLETATTGIGSPSTVRKPILGATASPTPSSVQIHPISGLSHPGSIRPQTLGRIHPMSGGGPIVLTTNCTYGTGNQRQKCTIASVPYPTGPYCVNVAVHLSDGTTQYSNVVCFSACNVGVSSNPSCLPQCPTCMQNNQARGGPIDMLTSQLWYRYADADLSGPFGLQFDRTYTSSTPTFQGSLGVGWRTDYDAYLDLSQLSAYGFVTFWDGKAHFVYFPMVSSGSSTYEQVDGDTLTENADGSFTLVTWNHMTYAFDSSGRLSSIQDRSGNTQSLTRDSGHNYRISSVSDALGRSLNFSYDSQNRIIGVTSTPSAVSLTLAYDSGTNCYTGDLCSVTESDGKTWTYQYGNPSSYGGNHFLTKVTDPLGHIKESNTYALVTDTNVSPSYTSYRVTAQSTDGGANAISFYRFGYVSNQLCVEWTDPVGGLGYWCENSEESGLVSEIYTDLCNCHGDVLYFQYDQFGRLTGSGDWATWNANPQQWTTRVYGRDSMFYGNGAKDSNGNYLVSYVGLAVPSVTQVVEPITTTVHRTFNYTYYATSTGYGDQIQTATEPSVDTSGNTVTTTLGYNSVGLLTSVSRQGYVSGVSTTYSVTATYDGRGRIQTTTGPRTDVTQRTTYGYFPDTDSDLYRRGQLSNVTDALNHISSYAAVSGYTSYSLYGDPQSSTDSNSVATEFTYDSRGRLTQATLVGSPNLPTTVTYDGAGRTTKVTKPLGNGFAVNWDNNENYLGMTLFSSAGLQYDQSQNGYDNMSNPISAAAQACTTPANPCTNWSTTSSIYMTIDSWGVPSYVIQGVSSNWPYGINILTHDSSGNFTALRDANHSANNATFSYDYQKRITGQSLYLSGTWLATTYSYDLDKNLTGVTDPNLNATTYIYDDFGNMRQQMSPVTGTTTYTYNGAGDLVGKTDANSAVTTITYDAIDRPLTLAATRGSSTDNVVWTYDDPTSGHYGIGRLTSMTDPTGSTTYQYERRGLLTQETRNIQNYAYTLSYGYDNNGNRNSMTYPDGKTVTYTFDFADRPYSVNQGSTTLVSAATYQPFGPISSMSLGNGTTQTMTYQAYRYLPMENKLVNGSGVKLADYSYAEDKNGNITQINDGVNSNYNRTFSYDDLNRLTSANSGSSLWGNASGNGYTYDSIGDLASLQLGNGRTATFSYVGTSPKLSSVSENGTPRSVAYDAAGNETTVGSANYSYSPRNLLASGDNLNYLYDGAGIRRVTMTSTGSRFSFASPELVTLSESAVTASGKPAIAYDYVWFFDRPVAQVDSSGTHYTFADYLGTPELQMDGSANITWQAEYEPYGKVWALRSGDVHQPLRLPGQVAEQFDTGANGATERSYNLSRWYRPGWGRYSQSDPVGLDGGINMYGYAGDAPASLTDPTGLLPPSHPFCVRLAQRIENITNKINKRVYELVFNPGNLPWSAPGDFISPRLSGRGHLNLIDADRISLAKRIAEYQAKCNDPEPPPPGAPCATSVARNAAKGAVIGGGSAIVGIILWEGVRRVVLIPLFVPPLTPIGMVGEALP